MIRRNYIKACVIGSAVFVAVALVAAGQAFLSEDKGKNDSVQAAIEVYLVQVDQVIEGGPFEDSWDSLAAYRAPEWYEDAKFGIFIHWGVYSVPGMFTEWYPREMYIRKIPVWWYHRMKWGPQDEFGYKDFVPMFKAENFDPDEWVELFKKAGARYVVPVAEHHDGFPVYDCSFTEWNSVRMGPGRDIIGELAKAARRHGLYFGLSSHRAAHWWFFEGGRRFNSDVNDPEYDSLYGPAQPRDTMPDEPFMKDWLARSAELVDLYQPHIFWFDFGIERESFEPYRRKIAAYYYNRAAGWGEDVVLNYKGEAFPEGTAVLDFERSGVLEIRPMIWQTDTSVSFTTWGYNDPKYNLYKTPDLLISDLVDTVSKNGVLLLNVGPRPDGTIPEQEKEILLEIGRWLEVNGEAIYSTRPWKVFGEGPSGLRKKIAESLPFLLRELSNPSLTSRDIRFTTKGENLYAFVMDWPRSGKVSIKSLGRNSGLAEGEITSVRLIGHDGPALDWTREDDALKVVLPPEKPCEHAFVLEIKGLID